MEPWIHLSNWIYKDLWATSDPFLTDTDRQLAHLLSTNEDFFMGSLDTQNANPRKQGWIYNVP